MAMLELLDRSLLSLEQLLASVTSAMGPTSDSTGPYSPLDVARLERRLLLSGTPPGGGELIQDALSGADAGTQQAALVDNNLPQAESQHVVIDPLDRMIAWHSIAHSSPDPETRFVGGGLTEDGWGPYIQTSVMSDIAAGFTRIELHNPFGRGVDDKAMAFDQYLDALVETPKLTENFAALWRPITDSGIEVIAYIGSPRRDPDQVALLDDPAAWWDRALACVQPLIDAGMSIGLDAAAPALPDSLDAALAGYLENQGVRVYIEARPRSASTQWWDNPVIIKSDTWDRQAPELHTRQIGKHAWDYQLTGEVVRLVDREDSLEGHLELIDVLADGHTAAVRPGIVHAGPDGPLNLEEFLNRLNLSTLPTEINLRASDADGDVLTYSIVSGPSHGTLSVHPKNSASVLYTPDPYYSGTDAFTFQVSDGTGSSQLAVINLTVHGFTPPPDWIPPTDGGSGSGGPGDDAPGDGGPMPSPHPTPTETFVGLDFLAGHADDPLLLRGHDRGMGAVVLGSGTSWQQSIRFSPTMELSGSRQLPGLMGADFTSVEGRHRIPGALDRNWADGRPGFATGRVQHVELALQEPSGSSGEPLTDAPASPEELSAASDEAEPTSRRDPDGSENDAPGTLLDAARVRGQAPGEEIPLPSQASWWNLIDWDLLRRLFVYVKTFG